MEIRNPAYWHYIASRAWKATCAWFKANYLGATGVSLGVLVLVQGITWYVLGSKDLWANLMALAITLAALLLASVVFFIAQFVRLPIVIDQEKSIELEALQREIDRPLRIVFGAGDPYVEERSVLSTPPGYAWTCRLFRVGILNAGKKSIDQVEVRLVRREPGGGVDVGRAFPLKDEPGVTSFTVHPRDRPTRFVDIVDHVNGGPNKEHFRWRYPVPLGGANITPAVRCSITLEVSGRDVPASQEHFVVYPDADGIHFEEE
jgi:hypothetical protein